MSTSTWKTVRVFISSTFRDMHAERDHLVKVVFPRVRAWCEARRLHLVDIDLRWGVTKNEADNGKAIEICLKEIDGSRPFFVCILGNRYGWVPDRLPPEEMYKFRGLQTGTHLSITHLEIIHATQTPVPRADGKCEPVCAHSFFYFRDPKCVPRREDVPEAARAEFAEAFYEALPARGRMLDDLKRDIGTRYSAVDHVFDYRGVWDAQAENPEDEKLVGRLTELDVFGMRVEADLIRGIGAQFAEHIAGLSGETDPLAEERSFHEAFIENRTQVHVPRADVEAKIGTYVNDDTTRPLVLSGPPGSGKSAILAHWVKENVDLETGLAKQDGATLVLPRFIGASPASTNIARLLANLCEELRTKYDLEEEVEVEVAGAEPGQTAKRTITQSMAVPVDPIEVLKKWPKFLEAISAKSNVLIIIDAINQLDRTTDPTRLYWLLRELPANVKLIVSVLDHGDVSKEDYRPKPGETPDWLNMLRRLKYTEVAVPELDVDGRKRIIHELPNVFCKSLDDAQIATLLKNDATKNPLFLTVALEELRVFGSYDRLRERIETLPKSEDAATGAIERAIESMFGQVLDRLEGETKRQTPGLVPALFAYLASAREGLSEDELDALLARKLPSLDARTRTGAMQIVLRQVRAYTMRKGTLVDFYHRSFWKAVRANYLAPADARHTAHVEIAEYFDTQDWFAESLEAQRERAKRLPATPRPSNLRKVTELPWQRLAAAGAWETQGLTQAEQSGDGSVPALSQPAPRNPSASSISSTPSTGSTASTTAPTLRHCATESDFTAIESLFTTLDFLESKNEAGMVFDLARDFSDAVRVLPNDRPKHRIVGLLEEALRRDIHFIARHVKDYPQALFQCLWNSCWWYDCPDAGKHYVEPEGGWTEMPPWTDNVGKVFGILRLFQRFLNGALKNAATTPRLYQVLKAWRRQKKGQTPNFFWLRSQRPPLVHLGTSQKMVLHGHVGTVRSVMYSPDGIRIVSGSNDRTLRIWDVASGQKLRCLHGHLDQVASVAYSPDGTQIVSSSSWESDLFLSDENNIDAVRVWDAASGEPLLCLRGHKQPVNCVKFSPDGAQILGCSFDNTVLAWDAASGAQILCLRLPNRDVRCVAYSPDGTRIVFNSTENEIWLWDTALGRHLHCLRGHTDDVTCVAYSPDGTRIISSSKDGTLRLWSATSGKELCCLRGHTDKVGCVVYSPDGTQIISGSNDKTVRVWDAGSGENLYCLRGHEDWVSSVAYSPEGSSIVSGSLDKTLRVWNATSGDELRYLRGHTDDLNFLTYSPDGTRIVSGSYDETVRVWDSASGEELRCLRRGGTRVTGNASRKSRVAELLSKNALFSRGYDAAKSFMLGTVNVVYSPDREQIVPGSEDDTSGAWGAGTETELRRLCGNKYSSFLEAGTAFGRELDDVFKEVASADWDGDVDEGPPSAEGTPRQQTDPFCLKNHRQERQSVARDIATDAPVAYYPSLLKRIAAHPSARQWAGNIGNHIHLVGLEGSK